ncbi:MAG: type II toxin-antitoxin system Phd/YefM family antitoxin [Pirellulales bacterium]|nr:type II toxin-antitoxin system Phd/YefM family antitoxin [Pirellulales bacterium]
MTTLSITEIRDNLSDAINRVAYKQERILVRRSGKDVVAIVSIEDLAALEALEDQRDIKAAKVALAESNERIPYKRVRRELGL